MLRHSTVIGLFLYFYYYTAGHGVALLWLSGGEAGSGHHIIPALADIFPLPFFPYAYRSLLLSAQPQNAPSGIAQQLRSTSDIHDPSVDAMNIDDFIFADEGAVSVPDSSPQPAAAPSLSGPQTAAVKKNRSSKALAAAIPIKGRKGSTNQFVAQSVPVPPHHQRGQNDEFHYIPRNDRKTSIDDRRVSTTPSISSRTQSRSPFSFFFSPSVQPPNYSVVVASLIALTCMHAFLSFLFIPLLIFCPLRLWSSSLPFYLLLIAVYFFSQ